MTEIIIEKKKPFWPWIVLGAVVLLKPVLGPMIVKRFFGAVLLTQTLITAKNYLVESRKKGNSSE